MTVHLLVVVVVLVAFVAVPHRQFVCLLLLLCVDHAVAHEPVLEGVVEHVQREGVAQDLDPV